MNGEFLFLKTLCGRFPQMDYLKAGNPELNRIDFDDRRRKENRKNLRSQAFSFNYCFEDRIFGYQNLLL